MRFLVELEGAATLDALVTGASAVHAAGLDGVALRAGPALPAPLVAAAAVAAAVPDVLVAATVALGDRHPIEVAEEAAVVDVGTGGRLVLVAAPAPGREDAYEEAVDLVRLATAAAPFRVEAGRWRVPANLPAHRHAVERRARVTPAPARPRLELWTAGPTLPIGPLRGLGHVCDASEDPARAGAAFAAAADASPAALGAPRARRHAWTGSGDLLAALGEGRDAFRQDWALVSAPVEAIAEIGARVRPRVQLDRLPEGLEEHWDARPA